MDLINCPKCGKIFTRINRPICDECFKAEEELFDTVKEYLDEHPNCQLDELSKETGASVKKIMRYLREGRLEISNGMKGTLRCVQCNAPIESGKYCEKCVIEVRQAMDQLFGDSKKQKTLKRKTFIEDDDTIGWFENK